MRLPRRRIGTMAIGYIAAAISDICQSSQTIDPTRPMTVSMSATPLIDLVSASRMAAASTVKRVACRAGASRTTLARSARVRARNRSACKASITRSTTDCTATAWPNCATALAQVTRMITSGSSQIEVRVGVVEPVEALLDDDGIERGEPGQRHGAEHGEHDAPAVPRQVVAQQAADQRLGGRIGGKDGHGGGGYQLFRGRRNGRPPGLGGDHRGKPRPAGGGVIGAAALQPPAPHRLQHLADARSPAAAPPRPRRGP